jgi:alpha-tubulin suppressor-like RCC1 family protein
MKHPTALRFRSFAATNGSEISLIATDGTLYRLGETGLVAPVPSYRFKRVASSDTRTCAIMSDDRGACWGSTFAGALGNGIAKTLGPGPSTPQPLVGDLVWKELHTTRYLSCGLTLDGRAYCWGDNRDYRLGVGAGTAATGDCLEHCVTVPTAVRTSVLFSAIASGETDNCGIALDGGTWCWGALPAGVDPMSAAAEPVRVATPPFVSLTDDNLCGLTATGEVYCYTRNGAATTQADRYAFTKLAIPFAVTEFSFGSYSPACARSAQDGALYCWGTAPGTGSGDLATTTVTQPAKVAGQAP